MMNEMKSSLGNNDLEKSSLAKMINNINGKKDSFLTSSADEMWRFSNTGEPRSIGSQGINKFAISGFCYCQ